MVELNNGRPVRILSTEERATLDTLNDARKAALGRVLAAYVLHTSEPTDQHALDLHEAEQTYLDLAIQTRDMLNGV